MTMAKERILYDNYDLWETYPDDELRQIALEDGYAEEDITDAVINDIRWDSDAVDWETTKRELTDYFENDTVIFFGTLGLWNGRVAGGKTGKFEDLLNSAIQDCDYIKIYEQNGRLFLECSHHDGTNNFEIRVLTDKGIQYLENWEYGSWNDKRTLQDVHTQIVKRYSTRPQYCKNAWGC